MDNHPRYLQSENYDEEHLTRISGEPTGYDMGNNQQLHHSYQVISNPACDN